MCVWGGRLDKIKNKDIKVEWLRWRTLHRISWGRNVGVSRSASELLGWCIKKVRFGGDHNDKGKDHSNCQLLWRTGG